MARQPGIHFFAVRWRADSRFHPQTARVAREWRRRRACPQWQAALSWARS